MTTRVTCTGRVITETDLDALAEEAQTSDYAIKALRKHRRGWHAIGAGPVGVVPVRIDSELGAAVAARAKIDGRTMSKIIREALCSFLDIRKAEQAQQA